MRHIHLVKKTLPLALLLASTSAHAQDLNGFSATLSSAFIRRRITPVIMQEARRYNPRNISLRSAGSQRLEARVRVTVQDLPIGSVDATVKVKLGFACFWRHPSIRVTFYGVDADVDIWGIPVPDALVNLFGGQDARRRLSDAVLAAVRDARIPIASDTCPIYSVAGDGSVTFTFERGNECSSGQTRHRRCGTHRWGPGINYICANGYWEYGDGYCESCADAPHPSCENPL